MSPYFNQEMSQLLKTIKPDVFLILLDTFMLFPWFLNIDTSPSKTIFWFPSDGGGGMPIGCENILRKVDVPVAMARFGQKQCLDNYNIKTEYIPHGTEPDRFYKLSDDDKMKLRTNWGLLNNFVVGCVARNQPRKMLDRMIKSFALIAKQIPEAILLCHLDPKDPAAIFDIYEMSKRFDIENRLRFTGMSALKGFDWSKMNEVYNLMDVFFLSTSGEGFGIPIIEAMSSEVPIIATDYTTTEEIVKETKAGFGIKLSGTEQTNYFDKNNKEYDQLIANGTLTGSWMVERGLMDINDAAEKIVLLYQNTELRKQMGQNGRKAVLEKYDFNKQIGPAFERLMEKLCNS